MKPKVLILDIETSLMELYGFGIRDQYISADQIKKDWTVLSWAAKWLNEKTTFQNSSDKDTEEVIIRRLVDIMDQADIIVGHNSKKFDIKRINAKCAEYDIKPPSSFQQVDTYILSKKHFNFSSHTLEYLLQKLNSPIKKLKHGKFPGKSLWIECDKGNKAAFKEMATYNIYDVLGTEWLYKKLAPWGTAVNFGVYEDFEGVVPTCSCGSKNTKKAGIKQTTKGKLQTYRCKDCGKCVPTTKTLSKHPEFHVVKDLCSCGGTEFKRDGLVFTKSGKYQRYQCIKCRSTKRGKKNLLNSKNKLINV